MCGWSVDEKEEKLRIKKKKFDRREAYNLALGIKRGGWFFSQQAEIGRFHPLNKKLFTFRQLTIVGCTTLLLLQRICIDEDAVQFL